MTTRVLISDANAHLGEVMRQLLNDERGFRVIGLTHTHEETLAVARSEQPDVVLLDPNVVRSRGDLCAALHEVAPRLIVLLWTNTTKTARVSNPHVAGTVQRGGSFRQLVITLNEAVDVDQADQVSGVRRRSRCCSDPTARSG